MSDVHGGADRDEEQEVSLASGWGRLKAHWWLPGVGLLAGAVIGIAFGLTASSVWRAQAIVYLGQPFSPLGGGQIESLATNPENVNAIVNSESALMRASALSGIPLARLRSAVSISNLTAAGQLRGNNPLAGVTVQGAAAHKVELAANALASRVVARVATYVTEKVHLLQQQVASSESQLRAADARIAQAEAQQRALASNGSSSVDALLQSANLNSVIATTDARRTSLHDDLSNAQQLLNLASTVEMSHIVEPATASKTTGRSRGTSILVGALTGLIVGIIAALAAPIAAGRRRLQPAQG
jgi:hypothetical protein